MNEALLTLQDGRQLSYAEYGDPKGAAVLLFHGTPGSRFDGKLVGEKRLRGIRLIVPERPGYGLSDPQENRLLLDWIQDVDQLVKHLEVVKFFVIGISGGAPYAIVCAKKMEDQVARAAIICGLGPLDYPGAMEGISKEDQMIMRGDETALLKEQQIIAAIHAHPEALIQNIGQRTEFDLSVITPELSSAFLFSMKEATKSPAGMISDSLIQPKPWDVAFEKVTVPVQFWHGDRDDMVNIRHAEYLYRKIPEASLEVIEGAGHLGAVIVGLRRALDYFKNVI